MKNPVLLICLFFNFLLCACGSPINEDNFNQIQTGMLEMEVMNILGEPSETSSVTIGPVSGTSSVWEDENTRIIIQFVNGAVKIKNFSSRKTTGDI